MGGFWTRDITHGSALIYVPVDDSTHSLYLLLLRRPCYNKLSLSRRETQFPPIRYKSISIDGEFAFLSHTFAERLRFTRLHLHQTYLRISQEILQT